MMRVHALLLAKPLDSNWSYNRKTLAEIFGKFYTETDNSHVIMHNAEAVDVYQNMIETFMQ